jgi:hypothetical protein
MEAKGDSSKILDYVARSLNEEEDFHFLRLEFLHRLNIVELQIQLVQIKRRIQNEHVSDAESLEKLRVGLKHYGKDIHPPHGSATDPSTDTEWLKQRRFATISSSET